MNNLFVCIELFVRLMPQPNQIAAEEKAEDEDENGRPKDNNVDVQRKVLEPYIRHPETVML